MDRIDSTRLSSTTSEPEPRYGGAPAEQSAAADALDIVFIEDFVGETVIGIDRSELDTPQPVRMNIAIGLPSLHACTTDRIEDTINYAAVREALHALLASHGVQLLEALAEQVAQLVLRDFGAHWVRVSLAKPAKFDDVRAVGVVIERRRGARRRDEPIWASLGAGLVPKRPN